MPALFPTQCVVDCLSDGQSLPVVVPSTASSSPILCTVASTTCGPFPLCLQNSTTPLITPILLSTLFSIYTASPSWMTLIIPSADPLAPRVTGRDGSLSSLLVELFCVGFLSFGPLFCREGVLRHPRQAAALEVDGGKVSDGPVTHAFLCGHAPLRVAGLSLHQDSF